MINNNSLYQFFILSCCGIAISLFSHSTYAFLDNHSWYYGMDLGYLQTKFEPGYGDNFFYSGTSELNLFFGKQKSNSFGFELGASLTPKMEHTVLLTSGDKFPGPTVPLIAGQSQTWGSSIEIDTYYGGVNYTIGLDEANRFEIYTFLGLGVTVLDIEFNLLSDHLNGIPDKVVRTYGSTKLIPVAKIGMQYTFDNGFGFRCLYAWRKYDMFNPMKSHEYPDRPAELRLENSSSLYLGMYLMM